MFCCHAAAELHCYIFDGPFEHCNRLYEDFIMIFIAFEIFCGSKSLVLSMIQAYLYVTKPLCSLRAKAMRLTDIP